MVQQTDKDKLQGTDSDPLNPFNRKAAEQAKADQQAAFNREFEGITDNYDNEAAEQAQAISNQEQQAAFDRDFKGITDNYDKNTTDPSAIAREGEATGAGNIVNNVTKSKSGQGSITQRVKLWGKKKTAAGLLALVLGIGGVSLPFIGSSLAPFMFVESVSRDLSDKVPAFNEIGKRAKLSRFLPNKAASEVVKGCTTLSIRCKAKMIGPKQQIRMSKAGIEMSGSKKVGSWIVPDEIRFQGSKYTPAEWVEATRTNPQAARAQLRANNPKYLSYQGSFVNRVLIRFGLAKQPKIGTKGSTADRVNQMLTNAGTDDPSSLKVRQATDADGNAITDADGHTKYELVDGNGNVIETYEGKTASKQAGRASTALESANKAKIKAPPGPGLTAMTAALGLLGAADVACTINNMIGAGTVAARIAANRDMVSYAWEIFALIHKIKAGDGTVQDYEAVGKILQDADGRKEVFDTVATAAAIQEDSSFDGEIMKPNPNYGKTFMDAEPIKMSINGGVAPITESQTKASLAFDVNTLMRGFGAFSGPLDTAINLGNTNACKYIQNPLVRGGSLIAAGVAAIFSVGSVNAASLAVTGGMIAAMFVLQKAVNASISGSVTDYIADGQDTVTSGALAWTGYSSVESSGAQSVGMIPANAEELVAYQQTRNETYSELAKLEAMDADPLDITNQYSVLGSLSRSLYSNIGFSGSPARLITSAPALVLGGLFPAASAAGGNTDRYKRCQDKNLLDIGIEADIQCNVRYYMPDELLQKDFDEVALWMENEGCGGSGCVEKDTQTGLPTGYTPPDLRANQNALLGAIKGATIGQFKNEVDLVNDYGRFLEYCALRSAPFGKTFEEAGLIGGAGIDWMTGAKCRERSEQMDNFRVYTMHVAYQEDEEYEPSQTTSSSSSNSGDIVGDVAWPLGKSSWDKHTSDFLGSHYTGGGFLGGGSSSVDVSYAGIDGDPVYAMLGGDVTKQPLGRASYFCAGNPNGTNNGGLQITSKYQGGTVKIVYAHGDGVTAKYGSTVKTGDRIMVVGNVGNSCGEHLHMDIAFNDRSLCPQHLFKVMDKGEQPNFSKLTEQATPTCG